MSLTDEMKNLEEEAYQSCLSLGGDEETSRMMAKEHARKHLIRYCEGYMQGFKSIIYPMVKDQELTASYCYEKAIKIHDDLEKDKHDAANAIGVTVNGHQVTDDPDAVIKYDFEEHTYDEHGCEKYGYSFDLVEEEDAQMHFMYAVRREQDCLYCQMSEHEFQALLVSFAIDQTKTDYEDILQDALQGGYISKLYEDSRLPWLLLLRDVFNKRFASIRQVLDNRYLDERFPCIEYNCLAALDAQISDHIIYLMWVMKKQQEE